MQAVKGFRCLWECVEEMLFSGFVFQDLDWKFEGSQRFSYLWGIFLTLISPLLFFSTIFSYRGQEEESRAPP